MRPFLLFLATTTVRAECTFENRFIARRWQCEYMGRHKSLNPSNPCESNSVYSPGAFEVYNETVNQKTRMTLYPGNADEIDDATGVRKHKYAFEIIDFQCYDFDDYNLVVGAWPIDERTPSDAFIEFVVISLFLAILISFVVCGGGCDSNHDFSSGILIGSAMNRRSSKKVQFRW